jgi:hypothetical protein
MLAAFDYANFQNTWKQMAGCNAFADDITQHKLLHPHDIRSLVDFKIMLKHISGTSVQFPTVH